MTLCITNNVKKMQETLRHYEKLYERAIGSVELLAVSKQQSAANIREAYQAGLLNFGENYYQEALSKMKALTDLPLRWHFIGPIQSNKVPGIAKHFDWVHSLCRSSIAEALNSHRSSLQPRLQVCIQVKFTEDSTKSGLGPTEVIKLAKMIEQLPGLQLRGLMTIPPLGYNAAQSYALFLEAKELLHTANQQLKNPMDTLSMGMSDDLEPAIHAGATLVRIGRAIFGERGDKNAY